MIGEYQLLRYDLTEKKIYKAKIEGSNGRAGFVIPIGGRHNTFLVGIERDLNVVKWNGRSTKAKIYCTQIREFDIPTNYIHDGKIDSFGRLYVATIRNALCESNSTEPFGGIFRSNNGKFVQPVISNKPLPNDFQIDEIRNVFYLSDSCQQVIKAFGIYQFMFF